MDQEIKKSGPGTCLNVCESRAARYHTKYFVLCCTTNTSRPIRLHANLRWALILQVVPKRSTRIYSYIKKWLAEDETESGLETFGGLLCSS